MIIKPQLILLLFFGTSLLLPQENLFLANGVKKAVVTSGGIVFTDSKYSALYNEQNGEPTLLTSSPGCGLYFTISSDKSTIGFKQIDKSMNQIPSVIDIATKKITPLHSPVKQAGQVSFANNGAYVFTIGNELIVQTTNEEKKYDLGTYANIAPISPDAIFVAFNDNNDQIFLLNLNTREKVKITDASSANFSPAWSPDSRKLLYSSLAGALKVYDLENGKTYLLTEVGYSPAWSNDSKLVIFYKKEITNFKLINSDLYVSNYDGTNLRQITSTVNQFECDPSFGLNDDEVIYSRLETGTIIKANLSLKDSSLKNQQEIEIHIKPIETPSFNLNKKTDFDTLDIPYINQVYDTPDYYNGSAACGPTSAMMIVAFYKILPEWNITCSWPYVHNSPYGRYICESYRFRQSSYSKTANDPNGKPAQGAYGFMWSSGSSPYSSMVSFYYQHGITAAKADTPSYQTALDEINAGRPYTICNGLTTAGHIIVAHGTTTQSHTLIFNDPYGDKNTPNYPSYGGKNVKYDWPGYNNGYQNLNTVYWSVATNYIPPAQLDTLIDDLDFGNGFYMNNKTPASMYSWKDLNQGYNNHMWYSLTTLAEADTCFATWTPNVPRKGFYEVSAYISYSQTEAAKYIVYSLNKTDTVIINQKQFKDVWVSLGNYQFEKGKSGYVRLGDASTIKGEAIVFDAVKWSYIDSVETSVAGKNSSNPTEFSLEQNYPNPFNPSTTIKYSLPRQSRVILKVLDVLGREVTTLVDEEKSFGNYETKFNGSNLSSGIYFYQLKAGEFVETKRLVFLK